MKTFTVYLNQSDYDRNDHFLTVVFNDDYVVWHTRNSLIKHDGYPNSIIVVDDTTEDVAFPPKANTA